MRIFNIATVVIVLFLSGLNMAFAQEGINVKPTISLHGRIQYDFEFLKIKDGIAPGEDYTSKGQEFRRVFLEAGGAIYKNIKYKVQIELAGGGVAYRDMYIQFTDIPLIGGNFSLGSVAEPTGLEMGTSSKYMPFMERAMLTNTQNFRWNSGLHYSNFGIMDGKLGLQMSYAFNGNNKEGFIDTDLEAGNHFVARLTSPIVLNKEKNQLIHLGFNYEHRKRTSEAADYTLKFRPENHIGDKIAVPIPALKIQEDIGFELAGVFGPFSLQTEYELAGYSTMNMDYTEKGYYLAATYFITGEHRAYKHGVFSRVKPFKNFCAKDREFGALEFAIRYSVMDYSEIITTGFDDKVSDVTVGLNWYLNSYSRIMYNHVVTDFHAEGDNNTLNANLVRAQVDF